MFIVIRKHSSPILRPVLPGAARLAQWISTHLPPRLPGFDSRTRPSHGFSLLLVFTPLYRFSVAYAKCLTTLWQDRILLVERLSLGLVSYGALV